MVVNVFLLLQQWFSTLLLKEGSQIQTYNVVREPYKKFYKSTDTFCFTALTKSVTRNIRGVNGNTAYRKESFPSKESDTKLLQSIYFAYEVGIISSYSNRICYRKIAKSRLSVLGSCNAALKTVFENQCSTSNTTPVSYDVTSLAIITPKEHQRLVDPLLLSGVVTHNNCV